MQCSVHLTVRSSAILDRYILRGEQFWTDSVTVKCSTGNKKNCQPVLEKKPCRQRQLPSADTNRTNSLSETKLRMPECAESSAPSEAPVVHHFNDRTITALL